MVMVAFSIGPKGQRIIKLKKKKDTIAGKWKWPVKSSIKLNSMCTKKVCAVYFLSDFTYNHIIKPQNVLWSELSMQNEPCFLNVSTYILSEQCYFFSRFLLLFCGTSEVDCESLLAYIFFYMIADSIAGIAVLTQWIFEKVISPAD